MEIIPERIRQEWSKVEISVLVLASLLLQIFLIVLSLFRQRCASNLFSVLLWFSYLGADYVATLALGNLLNKQNEALGENSTGNLAAFWGPFLLLHLGGPDTITSYSLEDNQLWRRHLLGLLLQVFTAIFVFIESLPSPHLWPAGIVVFALGKIAMRWWSNSMKQYNFIRLSQELRVEKEESRVGYACLRETWDGWFHTNQQTVSAVSDDLKDFIFNVLKDKLNEAPNSTNTNYDRLCASRGEWVLEKKTNTKREWSVKIDFDESILLWHIATHLCYIEDQPHCEAATVGQDARMEENKNIPIISQAIGKLRKIWWAAEPSYKDVEQNLSYATMQDDKAKILRERLEISRKISEYMMFLMMFKPSILPVPVRVQNEKVRFRHTCEQTMSLFFNKDADIRTLIGPSGYRERISREKMKQKKEMAVCYMLLSKEMSPYISVASSQLGDACKLARELQELFKDKLEEKWEMISTVWVEMLCYAACCCGTEAHVKQLSHGGELLTHVWLIMLHNGITLNVHHFEYLKGLYSMHADEPNIL